mgnify:CR=1 FL=1
MCMAKSMNGNSRDSDSFAMSFMPKLPRILRVQDSAWWFLERVPRISRHRCLSLFLSLAGSSSTGRTKWACQWASALLWRDLPTLTGPSRLASTVCELLGGFILLLAVYHAVVLVPLGEQLVRKRNDYKALLLEDLRKLTDRRYFRFEMLFLLLFLLPEGFFYRVGILFLVDPGSNGGLSLSPQELAFTQGTVGAFGMLLGCLLGGRCIHLHGFRYWLWPMTLAITLPKVFYVLMAYTLTTSFSLITLSVFLEQFGFGFGIMAFVAYLAHLSRGYHPVMFYSYCFALTAIGITVSGALSGILADYLGYRIYFALLMLLSLTSYLAAAFVRTEPIEGLKL